MSSIQCGPHNSEIFFSSKTSDRRRAHAACSSCSARIECRDIARREGHVLGVWGGEGEMERRRWWAENGGKPTPWYELALPRVQATRVDTKLSEEDNQQLERKVLALLAEGELNLDEIRHQTKVSHGRLQDLVQQYKEDRKCDECGKPIAVTVSVRTRRCDACILAHAGNAAGDWVDTANRANEIKRNKARQLAIRARSMAHDGMTVQQIAAVLKKSDRTVSRYLRMDLDDNRPLRDQYKAAA